MKRTRLLLIAAVLLAASTAALAQCEWVNPPPFGTEGSARDLQWKFNRSDWEKPDIHAGPTDWTCDAVYFQSPLEVIWMGDAIELYNPTYDAPLALVFHINNYETPNPLKRIWIEVLATVFQGTCDLGVGAPASGGYGVTKFEKHGDTNYYAEIEPNPPYEEITWLLAPRSLVWIYDLHVRTVCVPEPTGMFVLLCGLPFLPRRKH